MNDLKLSLFFGILSRIITFLNQILSVPIIITLIGLNEFTKYNVMTAGIAWLITLGGCLLPSVVGDIARAKSDKNDQVISQKVSSSLALMFLFCSFIAVSYCIGFSYLSIESHTILFFSLVIVFASTSESIRQGLGENYKNAIYNGIANLLSLIGVLSLYAFKVETNLLTILIITLGSIMFLKMLNLIQLLKFFDFNNVDYMSCKDMVIKALGFILISVAYYFNTAGLIAILGVNTYKYITEFIVLQKIVLIIMGLVVMIRNPLWSIIVKLKHEGGGGGILKAFNKFLSIYMLMTPLIFIILYYTVRPFVNLWAKGVILDQATIISFAVYIVVVLFSYINSVLYYGLEIFNYISKVLIFEAVVNIIGVFFLSKIGAPLHSIFSIMIATSIIINLKIYLLIVRTCNNVK